MAVLATLVGVFVVYLVAPRKRDYTRIWERNYNEGW
jgi:hypothetical protein